MNLYILHKYLNYNILCYKATIPTIYSRATRSARSAVSRAVYTLCGKLHHYTTNFEITQISRRSAQLVIMCAQRNVQRIAQYKARSAVQSAHSAYSARSAVQSAHSAYSARSAVQSAQRNVQRIQRAAQLALTNCAAQYKARSATYSAYSARSALYILLLCACLVKTHKNI